MLATQLLLYSSAGLATNAAGGLAQSQEYDAWGKVRSGGISLTDINYTGQRLDLSGLLNYNARMYDPTLGRFISADSIVPGTASGSMDGIALKPLTVAFVEYGFINQLNQENQFPAWFQMSKRQKQQAGWQFGPQNPQSLNRYSYVLNNPMKYTDPSGHAIPCYYVGCASSVTNNSDKSVVITGNRRQPGCYETNASCYKNESVVLQPGESSIEYGFSDVDFIRAVDDQTPIDGYGTDMEYKVQDLTTATIEGSGAEGLTINHMQSYPWSEFDHGWRAAKKRTISSVSRYSQCVITYIWVTIITMSEVCV